MYSYIIVDWYIFINYLSLLYFGMLNVKNTLYFIKFELISIILVIKTARRVYFERNSF